MYVLSYPRCFKKVHPLSFVIHVCWSTELESGGQLKEKEVLFQKRVRVFHHEVGVNFSKETIQNYAVLYFFPIFFKCLVCVFCFRHSLYLWAFVFNYPIVSRCTNLVFQKRSELEVIYVLFCHGRRKVSLPENNRERRTLRRESSTEVYQI